MTCGLGPERINVSFASIHALGIAPDYQIVWINRFHKHLARAGRTDSREASARAWIARYAASWRRKYGSLPSERASQANA